MKKTLSIILSVVMLLTTLSIGFTAYADVLEEKAIDNFVENSCEIIREYDADKDFISEDENVSVYSSDNSEDFQTCRLIVKADGAFNDFGAAEHVKGFMDFHILQYENETDTENAYNSLLTEKNVLSVSVDKIVSPAQTEEEVDTSTDVFPESSNGHLCDWATERTQSAQVNAYIKENNIPLTEITVGVIDHGIDYNHEFLKDRIKRTYFNSSPDGNQNDELDVLDGHGTAVSSVVVDNTPESVSVAMYRVLDDEWENSVAGITMGILQAITDNVDIINISLGYFDENDLSKSACELADKNDIPVVCSAGNEGMNIISWNLSPAKTESAITVGAMSKENRICSWSNCGLYVDFVAPGEDINVAVSNNRYDIWDGTSFASPCVAGIIALIKSVKYDYSYDKIEELLKQSTVFPLEVYANNEVYTDEDNNRKTINNYKMPQYPYDINAPYKENGYGLIQLDEIFDLNKPAVPECNYQSGNYIDEIQVELKSDYPIYYTLDGSYPTTSSILYTEPIVVNEDTDFRAVAYNENSLIQYSDEIECEYQIFTEGTDDMFEIDENGCITQYKNKGAITNLSVPSEINGIPVKTFTGQIFNDNIISKIIFPDTLKEIPEKAFYENTNLYYVNTGGAKIIQKSAFYQCRYSLHTIDMPKVTEIAGYAFKACFGFYNFSFQINAPQLKLIQRNAFNGCYIVLVASRLDTLHVHAFDNCTMTDAIFPNLTTIIGKKALSPSLINGNAPFARCSILALELPMLKEIECNFIINDGNRLHYVNMPQFNGKLTYNKEYEFLNYCNVSKETAELSGLDYYDVNALGGSIRITDAGMRFGFSFDESQTDKVEEYGFVYSYSQKDKFIIGDEGVKKAPAQKILTEDNITKFNLVFTSVPKSAYEQIISARAYVKIDGQYYYSNVLQRSFSGVANAVLNDESIGQDVKDRINEILNGGQQ